MLSLISAPQSTLPGLVLSSLFTVCLVGVTLPGHQHRSLQAQPTYKIRGTLLAVQRVRLHASKAEAVSLISGQNPHLSQLAAWCGQKHFFNFLNQNPQIIENSIYPSLILIALQIPWFLNYEFALLVFSKWEKWDSTNIPVLIFLLP